MNVMVTGGAGYIGSHAVRQLLDGGHVVTVIDDLSNGHRHAVDPRAKFDEVATHDRQVVASILNRDNIGTVMHFAAFTSVGESVAQPLSYYHNNTAGAVALLQAMDDAGVKRIVFSSTAAVYGEPRTVPITEDQEKAPVNPYGQSKWMTEQMLHDRAAADPEFAFAVLRYFNVAGCAADGSLGEEHDPETHLIPLVLQAALGKRKHITIYGEDYPTPDGTCIRDYVHVDDLSGAHVLAMESLKNGDLRTYNLGIGRGFSVRQVIDAASQVVGKPIPTCIGDRRDGDPSQLFADPTVAMDELGWIPKYTDLEDIIETAWCWFNETTGTAHVKVLES